MIRLHNQNRTHTFIDVESGQFISLPKDPTDKPPVNADINGLQFFGKSTQDGEPTPDNPVDLVNIPPEFNLTACGRNLFFRKEPLSVSNNGCTHTWNPSTQEYKITGVGQGVNTYAIMELSYPLKFTDGMFFRIWATGTTPSIIYPRLRNAINGNVAAISIPSGTHSNTRFQGYLREVEDNTVVTFSPVVSVPEGETIDITFKIMISYDDAAYEPYQGSIYPYRIEDLDGNLHELCSLPDGTADEYDRDNNKLIKRVKCNIISNGTGWFYENLATRLCKISYIDTTNAWEGATNWVTNFNLRCNIANVTGAHTVGSCHVFYNTNGTQLGITLLEFELSSLDSTGAKAWINAQIAAHGNIIFMYKYATPQIIPIKQYGETYNGQVWLYNQKPKSIQYHTNIFTDVGAEMQCEVRKLGNRKMSEFYWVTENGDKITTEDEDYIMFEY